MATAAFNTEAAKKEGAKPRALLQIDLPVAGTLYLSDQEITIGANTYKPLISDWGDLLTAEDTTGNFDLTILNHDDPTDGRFSDYEVDNIFTNGSVRLYKWFSGLAEADMKPDFKGVIDSKSYNLRDMTLTINDGSHMEHKPLPVKTLSFYDYTNARQDDYNKYFPFCYGELGEELNAAKINKGFGSAPTRLINKGQRKYIVAGHVSYSLPTTVWAYFTALPDGYAYIEGCTVNANDGGFSTVVIPSDLLCRYFHSALTEGNYFTCTAQNPENVTNRDTATTALLNTTYPLLNVAVGPVDEAGDISKVIIATSAAHTGCRTRWAGPRSYVYTAITAGDTSIQIDSGAGIDNSGYMEINGDRFTYTSLTDNGSYWTVGGIPDTGADSLNSSHSVDDPVVMVGPWYTLTTAEIDVTADRDWSKFDLYKFELVVEWQSGADYEPSWVGFRLEFVAKDYPNVYVPIKGYSLTYRQNAVEQIKHIFTTHLGRSSGDIGATFAQAISDLEAEGWKTDFSLHDVMNSREIIKGLKESCKGRYWLDGEGKPQIKIFKFGEKSSRVFSYDVDIIDPEGTGFTVSDTPVDEIYNTVRINFRKGYHTGQYTEQYYITPTEAYPADATRVAAAAASKSDYNTENELIFDAPYIQDEATALKLLQYLFDYYHRQRKILNLVTALMHHDVTIGEIVWVVYPVGIWSKSYEVTGIRKEGNLLHITVREYGTETLIADQVSLSDAVAWRHGQGLGKDGLGDELGGTWTSGS